MDDIKRLLRIDLPARQSAFLWGARKTGKTTLIRQSHPHSVVFDLLKSDLFLDFSKKPALFRERVLALPDAVLKQPIVLDEAQKVPQLMDEVHGLIENKGLRFILCGSSARKLKRGHANLLGGRAWRYELFPLTSAEIGRIDLLRALNHGLLPDHYLSKEPGRSLKAYVQDYLKEEVFAEGLARNVPAFSRFFDAMAYSHGELVNYANIARDCGVDAKTVREYYQILVDTLVGIRVEPFIKRPGREVISHAAKFYLFDVGVAGHIRKRRIGEERGEEFGRAFEHFILMEMLAYRSYREREFDVRFWRTKKGVEADFVLGDGEVVIEVKGSHRIDSRDFRGLDGFIEDHRPKKAILVCNEREKRLHGKIVVLPWRHFLDDLWQGKIL